MTRPRRLPRLVAVGAVVLAGSMVVAVPAVPAQARTTTTQRWGAAFCGGLSQWVSNASIASNAMSAAVTDAATPAEGKALVEGMIGNLVVSTDAFHKAVEKAGAPDTTNGAAIQRTILTGLTGVRRNARHLKDLAGALPTTDPTSFETAVTALNQALSSVSTPFDRAMTKVAKLDRGSRLSAELQRTEACQALSG